ncbi:hypothetical protein [Caloranaerobacter sp. DY30410]|uniref:hypothetical protein n=1 Tax=Caloranaerobacter sp. DY30410 TaxID=3238305 RepID=UPI003CFF130C
MLKVKEILNITPINVEFDIYIPINIEFGMWDVSLEPTIYWRIGNFKKSLMEIGIGSKKGIIRSITLTQINEIYDVNEENIFNEVPITEGVPVLEIENNNGNKNIFTDELKDFQVCINNDKVYILLSHQGLVSVIKNDRVSFGLDKNNLICAIQVDKITSDEKFKIIQFKNSK